MSNATGRSKPFIREPRHGDVMELALRMRKEDAEEVLHSSGKNPFQAVLQGYACSDTIACAEWDGKVVAMFGVVGVPGQAGSPWMLATDDLKAIRKSFLRECRPVVEGWTEKYHYLTNAVWSGNGVHIEWLRWLGFRFEGSDVRNGETFLHFHRTKNV